MQAASRSEAKALGLTRYFNGNPCRHGHVADRLARNGGCTVCHALETRRSQSPGGPQRHSKRRNQRMFRLSDSMAARNYRMARRLRSRITGALNGSPRVGSAVRDLGCTIPEFREYIASQFRDGMTWDNRGIVWELDHRQPLHRFDLTEREQFKIAAHYSNYQPLLKHEHLAKTLAERKERRDHTI